MKIVFNYGTKSDYLQLYVEHLDATTQAQPWILYGQIVPELSRGCALISNSSDRNRILQVEPAADWRQRHRIHTLPQPHTIDKTTVSNAEINKETLVVKEKQ
jgi:hypothetical protein